jgi:steroid delta-isomerase-like uncharacterized protein
MNSAIPEIVRTYIEAYNARDVDAMLATLTDDVRFENVSNVGGSLTVKGKPALAELARESAAAFSSRKQTIRNAVVTPSRVVLDLDFDAVAAMDMPNGWKAGQAVQLRGVTFFDLRDGLIAGIVDFA